MTETQKQPDSSALLASFLESGRSERSFAVLVESLSGLVYASALRRTQNAQMAEEIMQNVFAILARKAESLRRHPALTAWLLETTRLQSAVAMRSEKRRQRKAAALSQEVNAQCPVSTYHTDHEASWKDALPVLDEALDRLPDKDRQVIIQRFYEGKKFHEIASRSGQSEAACKMRLKRALDKVSKLLTARGVTLSVTAVASLVGTELARSAPTQVVATAAPKALAASSSLSITTLLSNTIQTMSHLKTTTLTAAAVFAIAAIPLSQQYAEESRMQSQLSAHESVQPDPESRLTRSRSRRLERTRGRSASIRTPDSLLTSFDRPLPNRALISSLLANFGSGSLEQDLLYARIVRMSREEHAQLLADLQKFPCDAATKGLITSLIRDNAPPVPPQEYLERMIASGKAGNLQQHMKDWAKSEPDAALQWYREMRDTGKLDPGLSGELHNAMVADLIVGLALSDPDQAIDLYQRTPRNEMKESTLRSLSSSYTEGMIQSGDDTYVMNLLETHSGQDRKDILTAVFQKFGQNQKFDEGLAFVDRHNVDPADRLDYLGKMITWMPLQQGRVRDAMDWALSITPEAEAPEAVRRFAEIAADERAAAEEDVGEWLEAQPAGPVRDHGYAGLVDANVEDANIPAAAQAAEKIEDATLQAAALRAIAEKREQLNNR